MKDFGTKYGPWALVTGASSGIGEEFARQLAARELNLVLAARRVDRLEALADQLTREHGVEVRALRADLSRSGAAEGLADATADLEVGLLVNNAGSASAVGTFFQGDDALEADIVQLNAVAPMQLAHHFGRRMRERGRGGILFVSSTSAFQPTPYLANYAATKAYLLSLGEALNLELKGTGVDVTVLVPGATRTEAVRWFDGVDFSKVRMPWMEVGPVVRSALGALGRRPSIVPGGLNKVMQFMAKRVMSRPGMGTVFANLMRPGIPAERL